jgi:hypothetical protein
MLTLAGCDNKGCDNKNTAPAAEAPKLQQISGFGKWVKATGMSPDTFRFAVRPGEYCKPNTTNCEYKYPDTAFVDFTIPAETTFEVKSGSDVLVAVGETATLGDYQYRKANLDDASGPNPLLRIAVSVPKMLKNPDRERTWCNPTTFNIEIIDVSQNQTTPRSGPVPVSLVWGMCPSTAFPGMWYATSQPGTPQSKNPPTPAGDCPGGAFAKSFDVCERCGTSGLTTPKTLWGCTFAEAQTNMGLPGCAYQIRSGINCP